MIGGASFDLEQNLHNDACGYGGAKKGDVTYLSRQVFLKLRKLVTG
jgi:hypothetical protein